jgi:hypothetical protein
MRMMIRPGVILSVAIQYIVIYWGLSKSIMDQYGTSVLNPPESRDNGQWG